MKDGDSRYYTAESDHIISRLVRYRALEGHVQCPVVRLRVDSNPRFLALRDKQSTQAVNTLHDFTLLSSIIKNVSECWRKTRIQCSAAHGILLTCMLVSSSRRSVSTLTLVL